MGVCACVRRDMETESSKSEPSIPSFSFPFLSSSLNASATEAALHITPPCVILERVNGPVQCSKEKGGLISPPQ